MHIRVKAQKLPMIRDSGAGRNPGLPMRGLNPALVGVKETTGVSRYAFDFCNLALGGVTAERGAEMAKGFGNMLRQAQQVQKKMAQVQEELADRTVEATAGGGMVRCVANGRQEVLSLTIDREVVNPDDVEMLQDLVLAAVNEAIKKSQEMVAAEMGKIAGGLGLNLPGLG
jgi:DNA-binding YbaB/EbfC family protein